MYIYCFIVKKCTTAIFLTYYYYFNILSKFHRINSGSLLFIIKEYLLNNEIDFWFQSKTKSYVNNSKYL